VTNQENEHNTSVYKRQQMEAKENVAKKHKAEKKQSQYASMTQMNTYIKYG